MYRARHIALCVKEPECKAFSHSFCGCGRNGNVICAVVYAVIFVVVYVVCVIIHVISHVIGGFLSPILNEYSSMQAFIFFVPLSYSAQMKTC